MHKTALREVSKFTSGLILGDFLCGLWLYAGGYLPMKVLGVIFNNQMVVEWMIFDAFLFAFLVYYGWHMPERPRTNGEKKFHVIAGILFAVVALLHLSRVLFGWNFILGSWDAPYWINGLGAVVTGILSYVSFRLAKIG
jgi:uncharacterized integral membrane protein